MLLKTASINLCMVTLLYLDRFKAFASKLSCTKYNVYICIFPFFTFWQTTWKLSPIFKALEISTEYNPALTPLDDPIFNCDDSRLQTHVKLDNSQSPHPHDSCCLHLEQFVQKPKIKNYRVFKQKLKHNLLDKKKQ